MKKEIILPENSTWYECRIKTSVITETGAVKPQTTSYLVGATNCSEAEEKAIEYIKPYVAEDDILVTSLKKVQYELVMTDSSNAEHTFYKVKGIFCFENNNTTLTAMIDADSISKAIEVYKEYYANMMSAFRVNMVQETKIEDIINVNES